MLYPFNNLLSMLHPIFITVCNKTLNFTYSAAKLGNKINVFYKIIRRVRALLVNCCVSEDESMETRLWHHANFDWLCIVRRAFYRLVGNMSVYQENLFQSRSKKTSIFLHLSNYLCGMFYKGNRGLFSVFPSPHLSTRGSWENSRQLCKPETQSRVCITVSNSPNSPSYLDEALQTRKTSSIP